MTDNRTILLYPLTFLPDDEGVHIGRFGTDTFAVFPEEGAALVQQLQAGLTIAEAKHWFEETYKEELDMDDFLETLRDLTFIREDNEEEAPLVSPMRQRLGHLAFSKFAWIFYMALLIGGAYCMIHWSELRPHRYHLLFSDYSTVVLLGLFLGQFPGLLIHESMHMLAGWRLGIPSRLSIGRRMYILVLESSMPGIWGLPKHRRYLPFLAGMLGDALWFSLMILIGGLAISISGPQNLLTAYCVALAFTTILRFVWQFYFHLQTDIYYVIITLLGCVNLQNTTRAYLRNSWYKLIGASHKLTDESVWTTRDLQVARWYGPFYAVGWLAMVAVLVFIVIPVAFKFLSGVFYGLTGESTVHFWDAFIFIAVNTLNYGTVFALYLKERAIRKRNEQRPLS